MKGKKNNLPRRETSGFVPRLYVADDLAAGSRLRLDEAQTHYIVHVMRRIASRRSAGDDLFFFNGRDGEWLGRISAMNSKRAEIEIEAQTRDQTKPVDLSLIFVPLRGGRSAWLACKAAEMGVKALQPVFSQYGVAKEVNAARLRASAIEGAEQSESLSVPEIFPARPLLDLLADWPAPRRLIFCDETRARSSSSAAATEDLAALRGGRSFAILIGAEGGFAPEERAAVAALSAHVSISLGPRVMRAETAAIAALALFQAILGDWAQ